MIRSPASFFAASSASTAMMEARRTSASGNSRRFVVFEPMALTWVPGAIQESSRTGSFDQVAVTTICAPRMASSAVAVAVAFISVANFSRFSALRL